MIAVCTPWTVVSRSSLMSVIITFMFEPAKLQMNWASARGTSSLRGRRPSWPRSGHRSYRSSRSSSSSVKVPTSLSLAIDALMFEPSRSAGAGPRPLRPGPSSRHLAAVGRRGSARRPAPHRSPAAHRRRRMHVPDGSEPAPWSSWASRLMAALMSDRWVKACGKLPELLAGEPDLLGVQAQVVGVGEHLLEGQPRLLEPAGAGQRVDVPEGADREGPLGPAARRVRRSGRSGRPGCRRPARRPSRPGSTATSGRCGAMKPTSGISSSEASSTSVS